MTGNVNHSLFEIFDLTRKKTVTLSVEKKIGAGSFGSVYHVKSDEYQTPLVCKEIDLHGKNDYVHYSHFNLLRCTYREIVYLKQLGLLVGYQHDKVNHKMLIVMNYLPGIEEFEVPRKLKRLAEYASFCALRNLHRNGIAHMDPHEGNFLFDEKSEHAEVLDYGLAQDAHLFRQLRDFYVFLSLRRNAPSFFSAQGRATLWYFVDFYCTELKEYILAHQYETAQTVFCYASVMIAALCGASVLGIASILAQELIKAAILPYLSQALEALQEHYELRAINQKTEKRLRHLYHAIAGTMIVLQGFILALQMIALQHSATHFFTQISSFAEACINSQHFWQTCVNAYPVEETMKLIIQLRPWSDTFQYWYNNLEKYLFSTAQITSIYQSKIKDEPPQKTFMPLFNGLVLDKFVPEQTPSHTIVSHKYR